MKIYDRIVTLLDGAYNFIAVIVGFILFGVVAFVVSLAMGIVAGIVAHEAFVIGTWLLVLVGIPVAIYGWVNGKLEDWHYSAKQKETPREGTATRPPADMIGKVIWPKKMTEPVPAPSPAPTSKPKTYKIISLNNYIYDVDLYPQEVEDWVKKINNNKKKYVPIVRVQDTNGKVVWQIDADHAENTNGSRKSRPRRQKKTSFVMTPSSTVSRRC